MTRCPPVSYLRTRNGTRSSTGCFRSVIFGRIEFRPGRSDSAANPFSVRRRAAANTSRFPELRSVVPLSTRGTIYLFDYGVPTTMYQSNDVNPSRNFLWGRGGGRFSSFSSVHEMITTSVNVRRSVFTRITRRDDTFERVNRRRIFETNEKANFSRIFSFKKTDTLYSIRSTVFDYLVFILNESRTVCIHFLAYNVNCTIIVRT